MNLIGVISFSGNIRTHSSGYKPINSPLTYFYLKRHSSTDGFNDGSGGGGGGSTY